MTYTHPYARLDISPEAYAEIASELIKAGYGHVFTTEGGVREVMVMTGIALAARPVARRPTDGDPPVREHTLRRCAKCGATVVGARLAPCCLE